MLLDGSALAKKLLIKYKTEISNLETKPKLAIVLVGDNPASTVYVKMKQKKCAKVGIDTDLLNFNLDVMENKLIETIQNLNRNNSIAAIIVQLPLPKNINKRNVLDSISPKKDVDCLTSENIGKLALGEETLLPCTPKGIIRLLEEYEIKLAGKNAVVIGRSDLVGKPIATLLQNRNCTVTVCHSHTKDLERYTRNADILVVAVGKPNLITQELVKPGVVVIDVGISRENNAIIGDVDFDSVKEEASFITPVPGGVGPMTVACLVENILLLCKQQNL